MAKNASTETIQISYSKAISELSEQFRNAVNLIVDSISGPEQFIAGLSKRLPMVRSSTDWHRLCAAMDIMEDAEAAKANFVQFGFQGPTRYQDIGETYLRLYGVLNAVYLQRQAIISMAKYSNNGDRASLKSKLDRSEIVSLRNRVASHNLACLEDGSIKIFMASRFELEDATVATMDEIDSYHNYDINDCIRTFDFIIAEEILPATSRILVKVPNGSDGKAEIKELLPHWRNLLKGKKYISTEGNRVYLVGMSESDIRKRKGKL
jgi:hypothetical protein